MSEKPLLWPSVIFGMLIVQILSTVGGCQDRNAVQRNPHVISKDDPRAKSIRDNGFDSLPAVSDLS